MRQGLPSGAAIVAVFAVGREMGVCDYGEFQSVLGWVSGGSYIGRSNLETIVSVLRGARGRDEAVPWGG
jgi:hypothetical protein